MGTQKHKQIPATKEEQQRSAGQRLLMSFNKCLLSPVAQLLTDLQSPQKHKAGQYSSEPLN